MNFSMSLPFTAAANLHEGNLVASYPYDGYAKGNTGTNPAGNPAPDDKYFRHVAGVFASHHATMAKAASSTNFLGGITNGAAW